MRNVGLFQDAHPGNPRYIKTVPAFATATSELYAK